MLGFVLIFGLGGLAWFGGFMWLHMNAANKAKAALHWPVSTARIDAADLHMSRTYNRGVHIQYAPVVRYRFMAAGREWAGDKVRFGNLWSYDRRRAEAILAQYPVGSTPPVRYNPANPAEAVLETTAPNSKYLLVSFLGLFFVAMAFLAASRG